jgi:nicotinamidase-related amidase
MPTDSKELADIARTRGEQIDRMTRAIAKLRAHGVFVVFVREMSAGEFLDFENESFPRAETWDALLTKTGTPGIFYADYPQLSNFDIPDWSHMTKSSAERYTTELVGLLRQMYPEAGPW